MPDQQSLDRIQKEINRIQKEADKLTNPTLSAPVKTDDGLFDLNTANSTPTVLNLPNAQQTTPSPLSIDIDSILARREPEMQRDRLQADVDDLLQQFGQQTDRRVDLQKDQNITQKQNLVRDLEANLIRSANRIKAIPIEVEQQSEGTLRTKRAAGVEETGRTRMATIQALGDQANLEAAQGNLSNSLNLINEAISEEFTPVLTQIENKQRSIEALLPSLEGVERERAIQEQLFYNQEAQKVKDMATLKTERVTLAAALAEVNAPALVIQQVTNAGSLEEAIRLAAPYLFDEDEAEFIAESRRLDLENQRLRNQGLRQDNSKSSVGGSSFAGFDNIFGEIPSTQEEPIMTFEEFVSKKENELGQSLLPEEAEQRYRAEYDSIVAEQIANKSQPTELKISEMGPLQVGALVPSIGRMIYGARISDKETERVESLVKLAAQAGSTEKELINKFVGFNITQNEEFANNLQSVLFNLETGISEFDNRGLARLINSSNLPAAITKVENVAMSEAKSIDPDGYMGEGLAKTFVAQASNVEDVLNGLDESPVGVVSGTMENWIGRLRSEDASKLKAAITNAVAKMRNELLGSAVTDSEAAFLEPLIPSLGDRPGTFIEKLNALQSNPILRVNQTRSLVGLPTLDKGSLMDRKFRVNLYNGGTAEPVQSTANVAPKSDLRNKYNY